MNWIEVVIAIIMTFLLTFLISYIFFRKSRNKVKLDAEIIFEDSLVDVDSVIAEKIKIEYEGNVVDNIHLVILSLINKGNTAITKENIKEPIRVSFGESYIISNVDVISFPKGFEFKYKIEKDEKGNDIIVIRDFDYLEPKEKIEFFVLVFAKEIETAISGITVAPRKTVDFVKSTSTNFFVIKMSRRRFYVILVLFLLIIIGLMVLGIEYINKFVILEATQKYKEEMTQEQEYIEILK